MEHNMEHNMEQVWGAKQFITYISCQVEGRQAKRVLAVNNIYNCSQLCCAPVFLCVSIDMSIIVCNDEKLCEDTCVYQGT